MRSVHTDTPPLSDLPARLHNPHIVWRASPTSSRERGALEHWSTGAQEQVSWNTHTHTHPDTLTPPTPAGAVTLPILELCSCHPPLGKVQRSKQPTNAVRCQAYPIYPHVTSGRRRPANLRRPNDRLSLYLTLLLSTISSLILFATPGPSIFGLLLACFYPFLYSCGSVHSLLGRRLPPDQRLASPRLALSSRSHSALGTRKPPRAQPTSSARFNRKHPHGRRRHSGLPARATLPTLQPHLARPRRPDSISMAHLRLS